jgi:hypothetical protein
VLDAGNVVDLEKSSDSMGKEGGWFKQPMKIWVDGNSKILETSALFLKAFNTKHPVLPVPTLTFPAISTDYVPNVNDWRQRKPSIAFFPDRMHTTMRLAQKTTQITPLQLQP